MGPGYNDLPPDWVWDFFHWLIIAAGFAPFVLAGCLVALAFPLDCADRRPRCPSCGQPWH
jgi:hypothetical protein